MPDGAHGATPEVVDLRVEHRDPSGLGAPRPRLSWRTVSTRPDWVQTLAEIAVDGVVYRNAGSASIAIAWPAPSLMSRQRCVVRVRVTGDDGTTSPWSQPLDVEIGLLEPSDWTAAMVSPNIPIEGTALLRHPFDLDRDVETARLHVAALGVFTVELDGEAVGDHLLDPGWTSYDHRVCVNTFDVTDLLDVGPHVIGLRLADGWYRGRLGADTEGSRPARYGDQLGAIFQLEIRSADGLDTVVATDRTSRWTTGPTTRASIYDGEDHDARDEPAGWSAPGFDDETWSCVTRMDFDLGRLTPRIGPPIRRTGVLEVAEVSEGPEGTTLLDFGQNLVGRLRIEVEGASGTQVELRHFESLDDGIPSAASLRGALATDRYTLRGGGPERWEPRFTFHGFRYATVRGWPGEFDPTHVRAEVINSDMARTGWFDCDDPLLARFHENVVWSTRGNFVSIPTDCPQRDERLGWTGDVALFAPTASFLFDCSGVLSSWLVDLASEQTDDLGVPWVVPNVLDSWIGASVWGDAAVTVPWALYTAFGDDSLLERQYPSMRRWTEQVIGWSGGQAGALHLEWVFQFGDWLDPTASPDDPSTGQTDKHLVGNAALCQSLTVMALAAAVLGEHSDAGRYEELAASARVSFARHYLHNDGRLSSDAQTAYALAIVWKLLPDGFTQIAGDRLAQLVQANGHRIGTGFVGTPYVCDALCSTGHIDDAYDLVLQTEQPSWLAPVTLGATTVWERWDAIRADGSTNPSSMSSFNHYSLGAVADWLHRSVAGLAPGAPGWSRLRIAPLPGTRLGRASAVHETPYGRAEAGWRRRPDGSIEVDATVPPNTTAMVQLPDHSTEFVVGAGSHRWVSDSDHTSEGDRT